MIVNKAIDSIAWLGIVMVFTTVIVFTCYCLCSIIYSIYLKYLQHKATFNYDKDGKILLSSPALIIIAKRAWADDSFINYPVNYSKMINKKHKNKYISKHMLPKLNTTSPYIYINIDKPEFKGIIQNAMNMWKPEINFQITSNPSHAQIIIRRLDITNKNVEADTDINNQKQRLITLYGGTNKKTGEDNYGLMKLIAHELGHTLGLKHDTDLHSIMGRNVGADTNVKRKEQYEQPIITENNRKVLRILYKIDSSGK